MIHVIVIDSGIYPEHSVFKNTKLHMLEYSHGNVEPGGYDSCGHGTAVAGIIAKSDDVSITSIKIQGIEYKANEDDLIAVLQYINSTLNADIINISLGVNILERKKELYQICEDISMTGTVIVSAFDNSGAFSYPAAFENVIGVVSSNQCRKVSDIIYINDKQVNVAAKGDLQRVAWVNPEYMICSGNSFACAHVSSLIVKCLKMGVHGTIAVLESLEKYADYQLSFGRELADRHHIPCRIEEAVVFPFSKEVHSLIRFEQNLSFKIVDVYDTKYSTLVGASSNHLLNISNPNDHIIKNIESIDWMSFDTIIIGHLDYLSDILGDQRYAKSFIEKICQKGKNIFSFDDLRNFGFDMTEKIYFPVVDQCMTPSNRFGMLYDISKPVLGIFGTSSKQGKYTLQMEMRLRLQNLGYRVGQVGTEPQSLLFGFDCVFPIGYNSSVYLSGEDTIIYLNNIINELCDFSDIIIVGSQSGTVPYDTENIDLFPLKQLSFLYATQPDAVVLCINSHDSIEYIKRTIMFIESSIDCKVIGIVLFPMTYKNGWTFGYGPKYMLTEKESIDVEKHLSFSLGIPVFCLGNPKDIDLLIECVIDFFS